MRAGTPLLDLDLYEDKNIDLNTLTKKLEVVRQNIYYIFTLTPNTEIDLISLGNPHGTNYPAIFIHCPTDLDLDAMPEIEEMENKINYWVKKNSIVIKNLTRSINLNWEQLDSIKSFPIRNKKSS